MDPKEIRDLIELISRSNFASFELEREGFKLKLVKHEQAAAEAPAAEREPAELAARPPAAEPAPPPPAAAPTPATSPPVDDGLVEMNAPIVGTFYISPGPDSPSFVEVGSKVQKGPVLCIVEAMKVMNEIESEIAAEVVEIVVANGQPVEYGEVLFRLRPLG